MKKGITALPAATQAPSAHVVAKRRRQALAEQGDVFGLLKAISDVKPRTLEWRDEFDQILDVLLTRSRQRPQKFAAEVLDRLAAVSTFYLVRTELYLRQLTRDALAKAQPVSDVPRQVIDNFLPRYQELGRFTAEILHYRAGIARQWALANAKQAEPRRRRKKRPATHRQPILRPTPPKSSTNGHNGDSPPRGNNGHTPPNGNGRFTFPS
jgi:hypothetical protein